MITIVSFPFRAYTCCTPTHMKCEMSSLTEKALLGVVLFVAWFIIIPADSPNVGQAGGAIVKIPNCKKELHQCRQNWSDKRSSYYEQLYIHC